MNVLDTTFLIDLMRSQPEAIDYIRKHNNLCTTTINVYEILRGFTLQKHSKHTQQKFLTLIKGLEVLQLTQASIREAANYSAALISQGSTTGDADCMVAGIAKAHGCTTIVTRNTEHFQRFKGLKVATY